MISFEVVSPPKKKTIVVQETNPQLRTTPNGCTTHEALAPIIFVGQLFSLLPISGYFRTPATMLKFTFKSIHFAYGCFTVFIMSAIISMFVAYRIQRGTIGLGATGTTYEAGHQIPKLNHSNSSCSDLHLLRRNYHRHGRIYYPSSELAVNHATMDR